MSPHVLAFGLPGGMEWIIVAVVALLIFGRRLPDVARSLGKSIVEFKKGVREVKDDVDLQSRIESTDSAGEKLPKPNSTNSASSGEATKE